MLGKLVKFIILSRVSKGGLIALVGFTVYLTVIDLVLFEGVTHGYLKVPLYLGLGYTVAVYALFSFVFSSLGGFVITKADVDYLFTLPIDRKTLGTALFLSYLVISALLMAFLASLTYNVYLTAVSPLLGISMVSLGVVASALRIEYRALAVAVIALWLLSPVWGFPFSPTSVAIGDLAQGLLVGSLYAGLLVYLAIRTLGNYDQLIMRKVASSPPEERGLVSLSASTPFTAFLKLRLAYLPIHVRFRSSWTPTGYATRVASMRTSFIASSVAAAVYFFAFRYLEGSGLGLLVPGVEVATTYVSVFGVLMSMSNLSMERAWLAVPYLGTKFLKYLVIGVYLQVLILLLPISVANFLLSPSNPLFLYAGLNTALNVPLESALLTYVFATAVPIQARDELTYVNFEYRARNGLPALVFMSITSLGNTGIALLSLPLIVGTGLTVALLLVLLLRDRLVRRVINRMTENGYV